MSKQMSVYVEIGGKLGASFGAAVEGAEGKLKQLSASYKANAIAAKERIDRIAESYKGMAKLTAAGGIVFSVKHAFEGGEDLAHEMQGLRNAGRSAAEVADGLREANSAISEMPTATLTNGIKLLNETTGAYGDYKHAVENLKFNSKLGDVLKNSLGVEDPAHELGSLIKALEIRGTAGNPEKYRREAEALGKAMVFYGGRLKSEDIYTFASNAPTAVKGLDEKFLTTTAPALIQEMGGDKAGTGLTAFRKVIQGGISDQEQGKAWASLHMIEGNAVKRDKKTGQIIGWTPGSMKDSGKAYANPLQFMEEDILPALTKYGLNGKQVDVNDAMQLQNAFKLLFKKEKSNAFANAIGTVLDRARIHKDQDLMGKVLSTDDSYLSSLANDPKMASFAIKSAMTNIGAALTLPLMRPFAQAMVSIAHSVNLLSATLVSHPEAATLIAKIGAGLLVWQAIRIANLVLGISSFASMIGNLSLAIPLGLAGRIIGVSRAIVGFSAASSAATAIRSLAVSTAALAIAAPAALAVRLRATAAGVMALYAAGGASGVLAALGASILTLGRSVLLFPLVGVRAIGGAFLAMPLQRLWATVAGVMALQAVGGTRLVFTTLAGSLAGFGRAVLMFPVNALRAIGVALWALAANPVGAVVAALVVGLTALSVWVYNNFSGILTFFRSFGSAFMSALGPHAAGAISTVVGWIGRAWHWISNLLGPLDATGEKWKAWGEFAGNAVGSIANAIIGLPAMFADMAAKALDALFNVDWAAAGRRIASAIGSGLSGLGGYLVDKLNPFSTAKAAPVAPSPLPKLGTAMPLAGARALGGPVTGGLPYLVGERGPEIFVPAQSGKIETNNVLNSIAKSGGSTKGGALSIGVDSTSIERAGRAAKATGDIVHTSLDVAVMPVVFTGSIDEATRRAEKLRAILGDRKDAIRFGNGIGGSSGSDDDVSGAGNDSHISGGRRGFSARAGRFGGRRGFALRQFGTKSESKPDVAETGPHVSLGRMSAAGRGAKAYAKFDSKAPAIMGGLMSKYGLTKEQAAGVVGNLGHESARFTAYHEGGQASGKGGVGWAQWTGPRRRAFERWTAARHLDPTSDEASWRFLTEGDPETAKAIAAVKKTSTTHEAVRAFHDRFERSADIANGRIVKSGNWNSRLALADRAGAFSPVAGIVKPEAAAVKIAGARAMGGPVGRGLSYLVGEKGPEIFTPGAHGQISTNGVLGKLANMGRSVVEGTGESIVPSADKIASARTQETRGGDRSFHAGTYEHHWHMPEGANPNQIRPFVESMFGDLLRQMESDQSGLLSD